MSGEADLWSGIGERLDRLADRDGETPFWLRDDDAVRPTQRLDRLIGVAADAGMPLALAVIPAHAEPALADALGPRAGIAVLQHGLSHANHAPPGEKRAELGDHRPTDRVLADLTEGRERLGGFPHRAAVLVPPWNRIGQSVASGLAALGFKGLSLYGDRGRNPPAPGIAQINTHLDLMAWKPQTRFLGRCAALSVLRRRLDDLLVGAAEPGEATGILCHHLVQDAAAFEFLADLLLMLSERKDCRFLSAFDLLANAKAAKR